MLYCVCLGFSSKPSTVKTCHFISVYWRYILVFTWKKNLYRKKKRGGILVNREIDLPAIEFLHIAHIRHSGTSHNHFFCQFDHLEFLNQTIWQDFKLPVCSVVSFLKVLWQAAVGSRLKILHAGRSKAERHIQCILSFALLCGGARCRVACARFEAGAKYSVLEFLEKKLNLSSS